MGRPAYFTLDSYHPLARGLLFAGMGYGHGSLRYHDSSKYGLTGTFTGVTPLTDCKFDPELQRPMIAMDGSGDYVGFGAPPYINNLPQLSVSVWVNTGDTFGGLVTRGSWSVGPGWQLSLYDGKVTWQIIQTGPIYRDQRSDAAINTNTWVHVLGQWTLSTQAIKLFINGAFQTTSTFTGGTVATYSTPGIMYIGYDIYSSMSATWGNFSDVLIWDRLLTAPEIKIISSKRDYMYSGMLKEVDSDIYNLEGVR